MTCTLEIVNYINENIGHIHEHGSVHTDFIATEYIDVAKVFLRQLDIS